MTGMNDRDKRIMVSLVMVAIFVLIFLAFVGGMTLIKEFAPWML